MAIPTSVFLFLSPCIGFLLAAPQGRTLDPNMDPFAPPPGFMPPPPPPQQNNYVNPSPPLPPQFPPGGDPWGSSAGTGSGVDLNPPPNFNSYNMVDSPAALPATYDINQPMPSAAASAGNPNNLSSGSVPEQEFEQEGGAGGSARVGGGQTYNPPPAFGVQPYSYYDSQSNSLLDAYYTRRSQSYAPSYNTNNNGFFGGLFGNSPSGNLLGAFMLNEFIF
ncbi:hypothetical protein RRG08_034415 [Elysia crispata]|uniref:Uncharacterized protein n=1 Tax=Elysia crispata TaxID=231223 RepID=A0AAE0YD55_9GAST|nr:hypothetical protein RRG08_034415 [Elysia crispata]